VLGSGLIALAVALELARRGVETVVLGEGAAGDPVSALSGPAGFVDPQARPDAASEALRDLSLFSRHLFGDWIEALEEVTGLPCEYDVRGGLAVALTEAEEVVLDRALDWQRARSLSFEVLPGEDARSREPGLAETVRAAFSFPGDGQVSAPRLSRALALAVHGAGVTLVESLPVSAVRVENGCAAGVDTPRGFLRAEAVVNAAGARAGLLPGVPPLPVAPIRTPHMLLDGAHDVSRLVRFVHGHGCGLVPRRDGTLVAAGPGRGDSAESRLTAGEITSLLSRAAGIVPAVSAYPVLAAWSFPAGVSPDGGPLLGETAVPGLVAAAGEGRDAVLLAPAAALLVADHLTGRSPPLPSAPYSPARFGH
jgi:glycine oxidase